MYAIKTSAFFNDKKPDPKPIIGDKQFNYLLDAVEYNNSHTKAIELLGGKIERISEDAFYVVFDTHREKHEVVEI